MIILAHLLSLFIVILSIIGIGVTVLFLDAPNMYPTIMYDIMINLVGITILLFPAAFLLKRFYHPLVFLPLAESAPLLILAILLSTGIIKYSVIDPNRNDGQNLKQLDKAAGKPINFFFEKSLKYAKRDYIDFAAAIAFACTTKAALINFDLAVERTFIIEIISDHLAQFVIK